jgi:hypothetical protein
MTYLWVFVLATFGGAVSYLRKLKNGKKWKVTDFLIEIITAAFAGLITFYLCNWLGISSTGTAALTGISGHFSSRAITAFGQVMDKAFGPLTKEENDSREDN